MDENLTKRFTAYLLGEMPPPELAAFESELERDAGLRAAWERYLQLQHGLQTVYRERSRRKIQELAQRLGPLPEPTLGLWDRLRIATGGRQLAVAATLILAVAALFLLLPMFRAPDLAAYAMRPVDPTVAGGASAASKSEFERAGRFYRSSAPGALDSLLALAEQPGVAMAEYYLAHWYLLKDDPQFGRAVAYFDQVIAEPQTVADFAPDFGWIRWNRLLAHWGATKADRATIRRDLATFRNDPDYQGDLREKVEEFTRKLD